MRRLFASFVVASSVVALAWRSAPPLPWIDAGHKITAMVAWNDLTPKARAAVTELLRAHPLYAKDLLVGCDEAADDDARAQHAFAVAATWPDTVRGVQHPMRKTADHPKWHYIDIPFVLGDTKVPPPEPAKGEDAAAAADGPQDVVAAIPHNLAILRDAKAAPADRAVALCWLLHLVGDIHQPLHACTLYSPQFPKGDRGGNSFVVMRDPPYANSEMNLHLLWDSLPGNFKSHRSDEYLASGLRSDPKLARAQLAAALAVTDPAAWAKESHQLAVDVAYLGGKLEGRDSHAARGEARTAAPGVPDGYVDRAERTALQRVALAGYRLADLLNAALDKP